MSPGKRLSKEERKKEIMNAAVTLITKKGFENTTMEDIVANTTMSKGGVYHYYSSTVEILKDIMLFGIEYRNNIIKEHLSEQIKGHETEFMIEQLFEKIVDDNPYMPVYVEFLIVKNRYPELNNMMKELQLRTQESLKQFVTENTNWICDDDLFQLITDFINGMIISSNLLNARGCFIKNKNLLKKIIKLMFLKGGEDNECI